MIRQGPSHRIGIDMTPMQAGGVNGGAKPAALRLASLLADSGHFSITAIVRSSYGEALDFANRQDVDVVRVDDRFLLGQQQVFDGRERWSVARSVGCDILFAPFGDPLLSERALPTISQRYDLQHLDHPEFFTPEERQQRAFADRRLTQSASHIVTCSEFSRNSIVNKLGVDAGRVSVIPLPLPEVPVEGSPAEDESVLSRLALSDTRFLYYPANFWPHKNHIRLIDALAIAANSLGERVPSLVFSGDTLDAADAVRSRADQRGVGHLVHILGFVAEAERDSLWRACTGLVFPSLYEGFGIPIQEAMLHGKPIATSRSCSLPEVGGKAALYFEASDTQDMAAALCRLVDDPGTLAEQMCHRDEQLRRFDPETVAKQYVELFETLVRPRTEGRSAKPASIDVVITECENRDEFATTLASLENQAVSPTKLIIAAQSSIDSADRDRAMTIAPVVVVDSGTEDANARRLHVALLDGSSDGVLFLRSGDRLLDGAIQHAGLAVAAFPDASLLHGLTVGISSSGTYVWERTPEPIERANPSSRRFADRASSIVARRAITSIPTLRSIRFAFQQVTAQIPEEAETVYLPVHLAQSPADRIVPRSDIRDLATALKSCGARDAEAWLIETCEALIVANEIAEGRVPTAFRVADKLLWAAPFIYALAEVEFDGASMSALRDKWRRARGGGSASLLTNPLASILASNPRDNVLRGLVGPSLRERASRTFSDVSAWHDIQSASSFVTRLTDACLTDLNDGIQDIFEIAEERAFIVSAFEYAVGRTPSASEVRRFEGAASPEQRLEAIKQMISTSIVSDWKDIEKAAIDRTPYHAADEDDQVYPLGSEIPMSSSEWFSALHALRSHARPGLETSIHSPTNRLATGAPSVTILCSLYDADDYIEPYLENMITQTAFDDCELVIVDACSPGDERRVIERYLREHPNIFYTRTDSRIGIYEAWNLAIRKSTGRYITNANVDDARHPESMERFRDALDRSPDIDVVYSDTYYTFLPHLPWFEIEAVGLRSRLPIPTRHNMFDFNSPHCAPMWRRALHDRLGLFDERYRSAGDWEFWLRGIRAGLTMHKIEPPLVAYFHNPRGMSTQRFTPSAREEAAIRTEYRDLLIGEDVIVDPIATTEDTYSEGKIASG